MRGAGGRLYRAEGTAHAKVLGRGGAWCWWVQGAHVVIAVIVLLSSSQDHVNHVCFPRS